MTMNVFRNVKYLKNDSTLMKWQGLKTKHMFFSMLQDGLWVLLWAKNLFLFY